MAQQKGLVQKKNLLVISHKYPPSIGGMQRQSQAIVEGMQPHYNLHTLLYTGQESKIVWFAKLKGRIKNIIRRETIDIIHLNDGLMASFCTWLQHYTDIPVVVTIHGLDISFPLRIFQKRIIPKLTGYDAIIAVSQYTRQLCLDRGFDSQHCYTVSNGVDHSIYDIPHNPQLLARKCAKQGIDTRDKFILITMGRATQRKGFSWFITEVLSELPENVLFVMLGPIESKTTWGERLMSLWPSSWRTQIELFLGYPSDERTIRQLLKEDQYANRILHLGKQDFESLMQLVGGADLFVMPNIQVNGDTEGFGLVALEASLRQTVVMASDADGIPQAVKDQKNGIVVPSGDKKAWINTIIRLQKEKSDLPTKAADYANYTLHNYSWEKMIEEYHQVFEKYC